MPPSGNKLCAVQHFVLLYTPHDGLLSLYSPEQRKVHPLDCHILHDVPTLTSSPAPLTPFDLQRPLKQSSKQPSCRKFPFLVDFLESSESSVKACVLAWSEAHAAIVQLAGVKEGYYSVVSLLSPSLLAEEFGKLVCCRWFSRESTDWVVLLTSHNQLYVVSAREPEKVLHQCSLRIPVGSGTLSTINVQVLDPQPTRPENFIGFQQFVSERTNSQCVFASFDVCLVDSSSSQVYIVLTTRSGDLYWLIRHKSSELSQGSMPFAVQKLEEEFHNVMQQIGAITVPHFTHLIGPVRGGRSQHTYTDLRVVAADPPVMLLSNSNAEVEIFFLSEVWTRGDAAHNSSILASSVLPFCSVVLHPPVDWKEAAQRPSKLCDPVHVYRSSERNPSAQPNQVLCLTSLGGVFTVTLPVPNSSGLQYPTVVCWVNVVDLCDGPVDSAGSTQGAALFHKNSATQLLTLHSAPLTPPSPEIKAAAKISLVHHGSTATPSSSPATSEIPESSSSTFKYSSTMETVRPPLYVLRGCNTNSNTNPSSNVTTSVLLQTYVQAIVGHYSGYLKWLERQSEAADTLAHSKASVITSLQAVESTSKVEAKEWRESQRRVSALKSAQQTLTERYFGRTKAVQDILQTRAKTQPNANASAELPLPECEAELLTQLRKIQQTCLPFLQVLQRSVKDYVVGHS